MTFRFLASYAFFDKEDIGEMVAGFRGQYGGPVEMFADSGAFSVATAGASIRLADYAAWLTDWRELITTAATLDVIGDYKATARNTETLADAGLNVLPTFHTGTPWPVLEDLCRRYQYVALGGMVPYSSRGAEVMRWLIRCFKIGREHGTVFHGFGQTAVPALAALPFYSVDSSSWSVGARYGHMMLWDPRRARLVSVQAGNPVQARTHAALLRDHGADPLAVGRPGFALKSRRSEAQFRAEDHLNRGCPAVAFDRLGRWLQHRHEVTPPPGWTSTGTVLYLADTSFKNFTHAATSISADHKRERSL